MNHILQDLADKAAELVSDTVMYGQSEREYYERVAFAKLLVTACADVVNDAIKHNLPVSAYSDLIKEHFGVK